MTDGKVEGQLGFGKEEEGSKNSKKEFDIISKEETMFRTGPDGVAIAERFPVKIYDRQIDKELVDEGCTLLEVLKKQKAIDKVVADTFRKHEERIREVTAKLDVETDDKKKPLLLMELDNLKKAANVEGFRSAMNTDMTEQAVAESRDIIAKLKKMKEDSEKTIHAELIPCNTGESYLAFDKGRTVDGKETDDWVADLISRKMTNPKYTLAEAKNLRPEWKTAFKEAIMEASGYKIKGYRDVMLDLMVAENKPLTLKKD